MSERVSIPADVFGDVFDAMPVVTMVYAHADDDDPIAYIAPDSKTRARVTERGQRLGFAVQGGKLLGPPGYADSVWLGSTRWDGRLAATIDTPPVNE